MQEGECEELMFWVDQRIAGIKIFRNKAKSRQSLMIV